MTLHPPVPPSARSWAPITFAIPALPQPLIEVMSEARTRMAALAAQEPQLLEGADFDASSFDTTELDLLYRDLPEAFLDRALGDNDKYNSCHVAVLWDISQHKAQLRALADSIYRASNTLALDGTFEPLSFTKGELGACKTDTLTYKRNGDMLELTLAPKEALFNTMNLLESSMRTQQGRLDLHSMESALARVFSTFEDSDLSKHTDGLKLDTTDLPIALSTQSIEGAAQWLIEWAEYAVSTSHKMCEQFSERMHVSPDFVLDNQALALSVAEIFTAHDQFPSDLDASRKLDTLEVALIVASAAKAMGMPLQALYSSPESVMSIDLTHTPDLTQAKPRSPHPEPKHGNAAGPEFN